MRHLQQPLSARSVLAAIGAVLLAIQGVIHLQLWAQGYREIAAVGPLFLAGGAGALALAAVLLVRPGRAVAAAGAALALGQVAALGLATSVGLFGFSPIWAWGGPQGAAVVAELLAVGVLSALAVGTLPPVRAGAGQQA